MKTNRLVLLVAAGTTAFALTGCAPTGDVAIKVGSVSYSDNDVDLLTKFFCTSAKPENGAPVLSRQAARAVMSTYLVSSAIDNHIADKAKVKPTKADVAESVTSSEPIIEQVAQGKDRDRLRSLLENLIIGETAVSTIVQQALGQALTQVPAEQQQQVVSDGMTQLRTDAAKTLDIEADPALGLAANGLAPADTSLSVPLSSFAKAAAAAQPDQTFLDGLPAGQRCN